ncbi:MAG: hypothetical protein NVS3B21_30820 [Acidimicrobiales bacterium]
MAVGTQLAAIVVSDLVGSTQLRARLGEDAAEAVRRDHDRLLTAAVLAAGGVVVKGLGDGVLARFSGAAEAVDAAVAIQQASVELGRAHGPVTLRVGVGAGDVTVEDGDVFGTPVIVASRLCTAAGDGEILVADLVRMLSLGRGGHVFVNIGPLELKGLPEPVVAARVPWEPAVISAATLVVPLQSMLTMAEGFPFAGRDAAVGVLAEGWNRAVAERRQMILISGEPGIGKTRLVVESARTVADEGGVVLMGRCFDDLRAPYGPFVEALGHLITHAPAALLADHLASSGGDIVRLLPEISLRVPELPPPVIGDPELERLRIYRSVGDLLARAGDMSPVLLVLDDLQWADSATVGLLLWLVRDSRPMRVAIVVTYRDTDIDRTHPLGKALADLRRFPDVLRLSLSGLGVDELAVLLERAGDQPIDDDTRRLAALLEAETEGNPFFVGEVIRHLIESGTVHHDGDRWVTDASVVAASVPEGVRDVVGRRMSALGDEVNEVLQAASVLGAEFDLDVLSCLVDKPTETLVELLVEPCRRRLILEGDHVDRYVFAHALIRQTLAEELPAGRRARLHRAAADAIETATPDAHGAIARHLAAAGMVGDPVRALGHAAMAADGASDKRAWEDAMSWYERALDLEGLVSPADPARHARLLLSVGRSKNSMGRESAARDDLAAAADLAFSAGDSEILAAAAVAYGGMLGAWVDPSDRRGATLLDRALSLLPADATSTRAGVLAQRARWEEVRPDPTEGSRLAREALDAARAAGDPEALLLGLHAALMVDIGTPPDDRVRSLIEEYETVARRSGNTSRLGTVLLWRSCIESQSGDTLANARSATEMYRLGIDVGSKTIENTAGFYLNVHRIAGGEFDEGLAYLDTLSSEGWSVIEGLIDVGQRLWIAEIRDQFAIYDPLAARAENISAFSSLVPLYRIQAEVWGDLGGVPGRLRNWERLVRPQVPAGFAAVADALACRILADVPVPEVAARCYGALSSWADAWPCVGPGPLRGAGSHLLGLAARAMGRLDDSVGHLRRGLELHKGSELPIFIAESHIELARTLVARNEPGDRNEAQPHLDQAGGIAGGRGFRRVERLVGEVCAAL